MNDIFGCHTNNDITLISVLMIILIIILIGSTIQTKTLEAFDEKENKELKFDKIVETYVVNLKNRPEKRKYMETQLEKHKIKYKMFEGIDGKNINLSKLTKSNVIDNTKANQHLKRKMRRGEFGCSLSHISIWLKMLKSSAKYFMIFEDDAYLVSHFKEKLIKILNDVDGKKWDILYLNENCYLHFGMGCNGDDFSDTTIKPQRIGYGLYGYIITRQFVEKCLNDLFPIYKPIDVFVDDGSIQKTYDCIRSKEILVHYNKKFASDTQLIL